MPFRNLSQKLKRNIQKPFLMKQKKSKNKEEMQIKKWSLHNQSMKKKSKKNKYLKKNHRMYNCRRKLNILWKRSNNHLIKNYQKLKRPNQVSYRWNQMLTQKTLRYLIYQQKLMRWKSQAFHKNKNQNNRLVSHTISRLIRVPQPKIIPTSKSLLNNKLNRRKKPYLRIKVLQQTSRRNFLYEIYRKINLYFSIKCIYLSFKLR